VRRVDITECVFAVGSYQIGSECVGPISAVLIVNECVVLKPKVKIVIVVCGKLCGYPSGWYRRVPRKLLGMSRYYSSSVATGSRPFGDKPLLARREHRCFMGVGIFEQVIVLHEMHAH